MYKRAWATAPSAHSLHSSYMSKLRQEEHRPKHLHTALQKAPQRR